MARLTKIIQTLLVPRLWTVVKRGYSFVSVLVVTGLVCLLSCSCTLVQHSRGVSHHAELSTLDGDLGLITTADGRIPYQRWRVPPWDDDLRYVWLVGNYDFRRHEGVEIILYFHGMHSKDYYDSFRKELEVLAEKRPHKPFLFVGLVDTPYVASDYRDKGRWRTLSPKEGERPEVLFRTINRLFKAFRGSFPRVRKDRTTIVLAGFSGGGRVLDSVGSWLAKSKDDPYAEVFRSRLTKIVYFDCWFDKDVVRTIPALLETNPHMQIVGTVHMKKPQELAGALAGKLGLKQRKEQDRLVGMGGRMVILKGTSHWDAMISRLAEAL